MMSQGSNKSDRSLSGSALQQLRRVSKEPRTKNESNEAWVVLIVDDDPAAHSAVKLALAKREFEGRHLQIIHAHSVSDAIVQIESNPGISAVLIDVVMERGDDGLQLAKLIRQRASWQSIRLIIYTGQPGKISELEVVTNFPIDGYVSKADTTAEKLFAMMCTHLRTHTYLSQAS